MKIFNLSCKIVCVVSIVVSVLSVKVQAENSSETCELYPIGISDNLVSEAANGTEFSQISIRSLPSGVDILSWTGNLDDPSIITSLTPPGDDHNYVNPFDVADFTLNVTDDISAYNTTPSSKSVSNAFDALIGRNITVPVWNTSGTTSNGRHYKTSSFAVINLTAYKLKGNANLSFTYVSSADCAPSNTKPIANAQSVNTNQNTDLSITLTGSDADSDPLTYVLVTNPSNGTLSGSDVNYTYTPNNGYSGSDSFTFKVNDGTEDSDIVTVDIAVNSTANTKPVAVAQSVSTNQDTDLLISEGLGNSTYN